MKTAHPKPEERLSIRTDVQQKLTLKLAAERRNTTISQFVLEVSLGEAERILEEERSLKVSKEDYEWLCRLMDEPPVDLPNLRAALQKKPVWDA